MKNKKGEDSDDTSADSDIMSLYSDIDIEQYYNYETLREEYWAEDFDIDMGSPICLTDENENMEIEEYNIDGNNRTLEEPNKDMTVTTKTKNKGIGKKSKGRGNIEASDRHKQEEKNNETEKKFTTENENGADIDGCVENKSGSTKEFYDLNDSVLVRYYNRKKWTYYVGFITNIIPRKDDTYYTIDYLKTIKKPQLTFVHTKKKTVMK